MTGRLLSLLVVWLLRIPGSAGQNGVGTEECLNRMQQADADSSGRLNGTEFGTFADLLRPGVLEDTAFESLPALYQDAFNDLACSEQATFPPENCNSIKIPNLDGPNPGFEQFDLNAICDKTGAAIANYVASRPPPTTVPTRQPSIAPSTLSPNKSIPPVPSVAPTTLAPTTSQTRESASSSGSSAWKAAVSVVVVGLFAGGAFFAYRKKLLHKCSVQPNTTLKTIDSAIVEHTGSTSQHDVENGGTDDEEPSPAVSPPMSEMPSTAAPTDRALVGPARATSMTPNDNTAQLQLPQQYTHEIDIDDNESTDVSTLHDSILLELGMNNDDETDASTVQLNYDFLDGPSSSTDDPSQSQGTLSTSTFSRGRALGAMDPEIDDDEIGTHYGLPAYQRPPPIRPRPQFRKLEVTVPPGMLGMVVDTPDKSCPVVVALKSDSILVERRVQVGDWLAAVDHQEVTHLSAAQVSNLIAEKQRQTRVLTFVRRAV